MNLGKETILAGVAGFALGLLAAWAVWSLPQFLPKKQEPTTITEETTPPAEEPKAEAFSLTLTQPENEAISSTDKVTVSGKTAKDATIVLNGPLGDEVLEASANGTFTVSLGLEEGANEINVTAYSADGGQEQTETRTVNYTKEEF